jgi:hypothetical protein
MSDRQRLGKDDEGDRTRHARPPVGREPADADSILGLQGTAGNQAVAGLLGRDAKSGPATIQRDEKGGGDKSTSSAPGSMTIPEIKLTLPIQSFQQQLSPGIARGRERKTGGDVIVTFTEKDLNPRLMKAATDGKAFATITIQVGAVKVTLNKVLVSGISMTGGTVMLQLTAAEIEFPTEETGSEEERDY